MLYGSKDNVLPATWRLKEMNKLLTGIMYACLYICIVFLVASVFYTACGSIHNDFRQVIIGLSAFLIFFSLLFVIYRIIEHLDNDPV